MVSVAALMNSFDPTAAHSASPAVLPRACDNHFHVFPAFTAVPGARYRPDYAANLADWLRASSASGISRGVVVQPSFLGNDNRALLTALAAAPAALRGVAVVDDRVTRSELAELHRAGVRGVRLNLMGERDDLDTLSGLSSNWWEQLLDVGLHVELHAGPGRMASLLPLVPRDVTVVLDHFAKPDAPRAGDATIIAVEQRAARGGNTYITLSGAYRQACVSARPEVLNQFCCELVTVWRDVVGVSQMLWGSDWPCTNHESAADYSALRDQLSRWLVDGDDQVAVLQRNPARLYWGDATEAPE